MLRSGGRAPRQPRGVRPPSSPPERAGVPAGPRRPPLIPGTFPRSLRPAGQRGSQGGRSRPFLSTFFTIRQDNQHKHALGAFPPPVPPPGRVPGPRRGELGGSPALTHPQARRRPARQAAGGSRERGRLCPPHRPQAGPRGGRPRGGMGGG